MMFLSRRTLLAGAAVLPALPAMAQQMPPAGRRPWVDQVREVRIGLLGGENEADRLVRYEGFRKLVADTFGVPVRVFPAGDYAGVMQGFGAKQLEIANLGASGYAGIWLDTEGNIEPLVVPKEADGSVAYFSVLYVRADSGITDLKQLQGKSLAWADPNSTSGYLIPRNELRQQGIDPEPGKFFSRTGFGGGHEQAVVAVLNKQYDAGVTWVSGLGDPNEGYTRGNLRSMVEKGMLKMSDIRILWQSRPIPNGPTAVRKDLPQAFKDDMKALLLALPAAHPDIYKEIERGSGQGYEVVGHDFFQPIIDLRRAEAAARRQRG